MPAWILTYMYLPVPQRHFLQAPKDVCVRDVLIHIQRVGGFTMMRSINLRFT